MTCYEDKKRKKKRKKTKKNLGTISVQQPKEQIGEKDLINEFLNKLGTDDLVEFINA